MIVLGERHLRHVLLCYMKYYNETRTHLSLTSTRRHRAPPSEPASFVAGQCWADCIISMSEFDLRQAQGRVLLQETFALALAAARLDKLVAQMTVDQQAAIALFESLDFKAKALLRDHVRDVDGKKHDIVLLGHDIARFGAQLEAYGLPRAVETV